MEVLAALPRWRVMAQNFLWAAADAKVSAALAIRQMQDAGLLTYRRTDMLADYRRFAGIPAKIERLKYVRLDYRAGRELYTEVEGYQRGTFRYQVNIDCYKRTTGETFTMTTNVSSDTQLTRRQIEEAGIDGVSQSLDTSDIEITGYIPGAAFHKPGEAWD